VHALHTFVVIPIPIFIVIVDVLIFTIRFIIAIRAPSHASGTLPNFLITRLLSDGWVQAKHVIGSVALVTEE
jgi:hypothetical protein